MAQYNPQVQQDDNYTIFWTNGCENSYNFISLVEILHEKHKFQARLVDIAREGYPSNIEYLPALMINNNINEIYQGEAAFKWIENYIKLKDIKGVDIKMTNFSYVDKEYNDNLSNFEQGGTAFVDPNRPSDLTPKQLEVLHYQQQQNDQRNGKSNMSIQRQDFVVNQNGNQTPKQPYQEPQMAASSSLIVQQQRQQQRSQQQQQQYHQQQQYYPQQQPNQYQQRQNMQISQNSPYNHQQQQQQPNNLYSRLIPQQPQHYQPQQNLSKQQQSLPQGLRSYKVGRRGANDPQMPLPPALQPQIVGKVHSNQDTENHLKRLSEERDNIEYTFQQDLNPLANQPQYYPNPLMQEQQQQAYYMR